MGNGRYYWLLSSPPMFCVGLDCSNWWLVCQADKCFSYLSFHWGPNECSYEVLCPFYYNFQWVAFICSLSGPNHEDIFVVMCTLETTKTQCLREIQVSIAVVLAIQVTIPISVHIKLLSAFPQILTMKQEFSLKFLTGTQFFAST